MVRKPANYARNIPKPQRAKHWSYKKSNQPTTELKEEKWHAERIPGLAETNGKCRDEEDVVKDKRSLRVHTQNHCLLTRVWFTTSSGSFNEIHLDVRLYMYFCPCIITSSSMVWSRELGNHLFVASQRHTALRFGQRANAILSMLQSKFALVGSPSRPARDTGVGYGGEVWREFVAREQKREEIQGSLMSR